ncbi:MAG: citrate transporter [Ruminococcaceae bacterium]|nr:citrate transporter [Oscillospiraceae bacterium]
MISDIKLKKYSFETFITDFQTFLKKNAVLCIAFAAALITSIIVPPDSKYLDYFDLNTLSCLFATLAVICALKNIRFFSILAEKIVALTGNLRTSVIAIVYITFIGSMLIANDMALLTFLPLGYFVLQRTDNEKHMAKLFVLQNISANLGGMLTPFGNPQNLYLYSYFNIPTAEFMQIMFLPFALAIAMITLCCFLFPKTELHMSSFDHKRLSVKRTAYYLALFAVSIIIVFRVIPYFIGLPIVFIGILFSDRDALKKVDYALLFTFVFFFIFAGNMARIDAVNELLSYLLSKNTLIFSVISCQFISNVPSAVLLSHFTTDYKALLLGVNIGGTGTLIASLASLITFKNYVSFNPGSAGRFIKVFTIFNFAFLFILTIFCFFIIL